MRRALGLAAILAFFSLPAFAAPPPFQLIAPAAQTATGQGGGVAVAGITEMLVVVNVTAVSGTTPTLSVYLQSSSDGGTTWYDLPHGGSLILSSVAQQGAVEPSGNRNIISGATGTLKAAARYVVFGQYVRAAWAIGGTTPSFTFEVDAIGK